MGLCCAHCRGSGLASVSDRDLDAAIHTFWKDETLPKAFSVRSRFMTIMGISTAPMVLLGIGNRGAELLSLGGDGPWSFGASSLLTPWTPSTPSMLSSAVPSLTGSTWVSMATAYCWFLSTHLVRDVVVVSRGQMIGCFRLEAVEARVMEDVSAGALGETELQAERRFGHPVAVTGIVMPSRATVMILMHGAKCSPFRMVTAFQRMLWAAWRPCTVQLAQRQARWNRQKLSRSFLSATQ